jgi:hypothetical protein
MFVKAVAWVVWRLGLFRARPYTDVMVARLSRDLATLDFAWIFQIAGRLREHVSRHGKNDSVVEV